MDNQRSMVNRVGGALLLLAGAAYLFHAAFDPGENGKRYEELKAFWDSAQKSEHATVKTAKKPHRVWDIVVHYRVTENVVANPRHEATVSAPDDDDPIEIRYKASVSGRDSYRFKALSNWELAAAERRASFGLWKFLGGIVVVLFALSWYLAPG